MWHSNIVRVKGEYGWTSIEELLNEVASRRHQAMIYRDAYITVNGVRAAKNLKALQPGQSACFEVFEGGDQPVLTMECDDLVPVREIQYFADLPPK